MSFTWAVNRIGNFREEQWTTLSEREKWKCSLWPHGAVADLPNPGIKPRFPALQADSLPFEPPRKQYSTETNTIFRTAFHPCGGARDGDPSFLPVVSRPISRVSGVVKCTLQAGELLKRNLTSSHHGWLASAYGGIFSNWSPNTTSCFLDVHNGTSPWSSPQYPPWVPRTAWGKKWQSYDGILDHCQNSDFGASDFYSSP